MRISLLALSPCGLNAIPLADALRFPERARMIELREASKSVLKLRRVYKLDLGNVAPPTWIGELRHLRMIKCCANIATLPRELLGLPRLRYLHFDDSKLASLAGLEMLQSLDTITLGRTPVQQHLAAAAAKLAGARATSWSIEVKRSPAQPPRDKQLLVRALGDDELEDGADLQGSDLQGEAFEDLYVTYDLRGAKLANTTWRRCDFDYAQLRGADLHGATFEDCYFTSRYGDEGNFARANLAAATFLRCGGELGLRAADLRGARFADIEPDVHYDLEKANAAGMQLRATFCSEKEHAIAAKGANLRGANIEFDVTSERRDAIASKPKSRFAWKTDHLRGAKVDKSTHVVYAPLAKRSAPASGIDANGAKAKALGTIHASNASLWLLAIDAGDVAAWRGSNDDEDKHDDFQRALRIDTGVIKVGDASGLLVPINTNGWSHVWQVDGGIALLDCAMQIERPAAEQALALRVAQWAPPKRVTTIGKVTVTTGVLALLLPYRDGTFSAADLRKARAGAFVCDKQHDRMLVPLPNGTYDVVWHPFGPSAGYEDEVGRYHSCTRFVLGVKRATRRRTAVTRATVRT